MRSLALLTDARLSLGSGLLIAVRASAALQASHAFLARTLTSRLVADLSERADLVTVASLARNSFGQRLSWDDEEKLIELTFAGFLVAHRLGMIASESFLAVVAVTTVSVVATMTANSSRATT